MKYYDFKLTGDAAIAKDGSDIQETLKNFFEADLETGSYDRSHEVRIEESEDEGVKTLTVFADDKEVGSINGDDAAEAMELAGKIKARTVSFGVNGLDIEEYETIVDRYKDKKFWKEEDPDFDDKAVNKAYNDLMSGLKEGTVYQAALRFIDEDGATEPEVVLTEEEQKQKDDLDRFMNLFKILIPLSVLLIVIGILFFIKLSRLMGILNLFFGALGLYFSLKYTRPLRKGKKKAK